MPDRLIPSATRAVWAVLSILAAPISSSIVAHQLEYLEPWFRREVQSAIRHMHDHYAEALSIREIAEAVSLSPAAFRRSFHSAIGVSPSRYLHRIRFGSFERYVAGSHVSLEQAARLSGWSLAHARAVFYREHGMSPRDYRLKVRSTSLAANRGSEGQVLRDFAPDQEDGDPPPIASFHVI